MTTVANCSNPAEAMLLKSILEANEIPAYVPEELTAQAAPNFSGAGIRVEVDDENADAARKVLDDAEHAEDAEAAQEQDAREHDSTS